MDYEEQIYYLNELISIVEKYITEHIVAYSDGREVILNTLVCKVEYLAKCKRLIETIKNKNFPQAS
jgi:hypothetical protein